MRRLICTFVVRKWLKQVFSWCCSYHPDTVLTYPASAQQIWAASKEDPAPFFYHFVMSQLDFEPMISCIRCRYSSVRTNGAIRYALLSFLTMFPDLSFQMQQNFRYVPIKLAYPKFWNIHMNKETNKTYKLNTTVMILSFRTDRSEPTAQSQIRLLLKEKSELVLHCYAQMYVSQNLGLLG